MKTFLPIPVLFLFLFSHSFVFGQQDVTDGYIITLTGDTIYGSFSDVKVKKTPKTVTFNSYDGKISGKFRPGDIQGFTLYLNMISYERNKFITDEGSVLEGFYQCLVKGEISLYTFTDSKEYFFVKKDTGDFIQIRQEYTTINERVFKNIKTKGILISLMGDHADIQDRLKEFDVYRKSMVDLVLYYNRTYGGNNPNYKTNTLPLKHFVPGEIIYSSGSKEKVFLDVHDRLRNQREILVYHAGADSVHFMNYHNLKAYNTEGEKKYVSKVVGGVPVFIEYVERGKINLAKIAEKRNKNRYFIMEDDSAKYIPEDPVFIMDHYNLLSQCSKLGNYVNNKRADLGTIVFIYNNCEYPVVKNIDLTNKSQIRESRSLHVDVGFRGVYFTSQVSYENHNMPGWSFKTDNPSSFGPGLFFQLSYSPKEYSIVKFSMDIFHLQYSHYFRSGQTGIEYYIDYDYYTLPISMKIYFTDKIIRPYMLAGLALNHNVGTIVNDEEDPLKPSSVLYMGLGGELTFLKKGFFTVEFRKGSSGGWSGSSLAIVDMEGKHSYLTFGTGIRF